MTNFNCTEMGRDKGVHRLIVFMPNVFKVNIYFLYFYK